MWVRKNHPYDGTDRAGLPTGKVLKVTGYQQVDGKGMTPSGQIYLLEDGSWEYPWNVTPCEKDGRAL